MQYTSSVQQSLYYYDPELDELLPTPTASNADYPWENVYTMDSSSDPVVDERGDWQTVSGQRIPFYEETSTSSFQNVTEYVPEQWVSDLFTLFG